MKKLIPFLLTLCLISLLVVGCGRSTESENANFKGTEEASSTVEDTAEETDDIIDEGLGVFGRDYLDALRGNLSSAGATLSEIEEHELNDGSISPTFTFKNSDDSTNGDYENIVSITNTDSGILEQVIMNTKNSGWAAPYAYALIGSLEGQEPVDDILEELCIDTNNGYYGNGLNTSDYERHHYSVMISEGDILLFMITVAKE